MKVSIIIPIYNSGRYLEECVNSALRQSYRDIEVLLVDDGSTDESGILCDKYAKQDPRVRVYHLENNGVSFSRNYGIDKATGDLITFLDSDDILTLDAIGHTVGLINGKNVEAVRSHYSNRSNDSLSSVNQTIKSGLYRTTSDKSKIINSIALGATPGYVWLLMGKAELVKSIKFEESLTMMEDAVFSINLLSRAESVYVSNYIVCNYTLVLGSASNSLDRLDRIADDIIDATYMIEPMIGAPIMGRVKASRANGIANYLLGSFAFEDLGRFKTIYNRLRASAKYRKFISESDLSSLPWRFSILIKAIYKDKYITAVVIATVRVVLSEMKGIGV